MSWRWRSLTSTSIVFIEIPSLKSHTPPLSMFCLYSSAQNFSSAKQAQKLPVTSRIVLTPHVVYPTLLNCPSDLIALSFFLWCARQPNYFHELCAFDHMATVVNRLTKRFKTVKGVVRELEGVGCVTKAQTFLLLLRIYWRGGMYKLVFEAFEEMGRFGYVPNTFARNVIMDVLFKIGRVDVALRVFSETRVPNFLTFSIAICNLSKLKDLNNIRDVLRIMLREGYYLNGETFLMVLNCFCKNGRPAGAFQILGLMITLGLPLSQAVWSILIDGFCKCGRLSMAGYLLEKMVETGCSPNVVTYTSLIKKFLELKMFNSAFDILRTMETKGCAPDLVLYNVLIDCLSKIGRHDDALDLFCDLLRNNLVPDSYTLSSILSTICVSRWFSVLPKLVHGLVMQTDLVVCNLLLCYFCKAGLPLCAVEFYNDMLDKGFTPDRYTFVGLLRGLCGAGRIDEAVNVYRGIVMNYSSLDAHVHTVIIDGLIKVGKFHRAVRLFRKAVAEKYPVDVVSYTVAIHGLFRGGRAEEACTLYSQMKEVGIAPNAYTYNVMLCGFCRERDVKMVAQVLQEMIDSRMEMHYNTFMRMSSLLLKTHCRHSVFNVLSEMWSLGLVPNKAVYTVSDRLTHVVEVDDAPLSSLKYIDNIQCAGMSSLDNLSDVAASVG
ncbi:putative pentatricopeptide repeat-containing protein At1g16830 [Malania oleifera]|uniref:putative pentatricopeptide repeat-containing protein At1g16830 n=1 Tax=Malania oleifera TaxID=397392 RepID=UPI0025ADAD64|nr:putative pentatricopeptide repeat-containing protein At1g16830 [Malania oleifera]